MKKKVKIQAIISTLLKLQQNHNNSFELISFYMKSRCISSIRINIFPTIFWTNAYYLQQNRVRQLHILNISYKYTKVLNFTYVHNNLVCFLFYFPFGRDKYKSRKSLKIPNMAYELDFLSCQNQQVIFSYPVLLYIKEEEFFLS